ncbi:MAG: AAA family ATPase, partial [Clostridiaceae bacterium]|nr:AAA family ATPase [Clostridiaceae bacterium]
MFETFYGFERTPFTRSIDTDGLFLSQKTDEMLARLQVAASRQWFALLTGDCGTGKSTLIRKLSAMLADKKDFRVLYLADSKLTPRHFYNGLLE